MTQETIIQALNIVAMTISAMWLAWLNRRNKKAIDHTKAVVEASAQKIEHTKAVVDANAAKVDVVEIKAREVKHALANSTQHRDLELQIIKEAQVDIIRLLNGERLQLMETIRDLTARIAKSSGKPEDQTMALFAERKYNDHKRTLDKYYSSKP